MKNWDMVKLGDVIFKPISGEWGDGEGETSVLRTTNFRNDGRLNFENVVKRNIPEKKIREKALRPGDCIIEKSGGGPSQPVGRVVYFDVPDKIFLCNNFTSVVRPKPRIFPKYLFWYLFNNHLIGNTLSYQNKTTGITNLQLERYISEALIPLPPLATQQRIAEILDKADALRQKDQALLRKYDELAQAVFVDMFGDPVRNEKGWEVEKLKDLVNNHNNRRVPVKESDRQKLHGEYPYYGATGIIDYINDFLFDGKFLLIAEDGKNLLIRKRKNAFLAEGQFWVNNHAHILSFNGKAELQFLEFYLNQIDLKPYVTGIDQFKLTRTDLDRITIFVPPISLQTTFSTISTNIECQKQLTRKIQAEDEALFAKLLQELF
jgi:type I restriction enzyme S subunit